MSTIFIELSMDQVHAVCDISHVCQNIQYGCFSQLPLNYDIQIHISEQNMFYQYLNFTSKLYQGSTHSLLELTPYILCFPKVCRLKNSGCQLFNYLQCLGGSLAWTMITAIGENQITLNSWITLSLKIRDKQIGGQLCQAQFKLSQL